MIKAINNAEGLEVTKPKKDVILLTGHFGNGSSGRIPILVKDAPSIFDSTDPIEFSVMHKGKRRLIGIVDWKPQATGITFLLRYQIFVDSDEFRRETERVLAS